MLWLAIGTYLLFINVASFAMFVVDKFAAERGEWRIAESTLLLAALMGGSVGAISAQRILRHKTRKQPFLTVLYFIAAAHLLTAGLLIYTPSRQATFYCLFKSGAMTWKARQIVGWLGCQ